MALTATMHRVEIALEDSDRNLYTALEARIARHPSETLRHVVARLCAFALQHEEGIVLGPPLTDELQPTIGVRDLRGDLRAWIEVGSPSADRLHRASKACARVVVYVDGDPRNFLREVGTRTIHRVEHIEAFALDASFLDAVGASLERTAKWQLVVSGGTIYLTTGGRMHETEIRRLTLAPA